MCGRASSYTPPDRIAELFGADPEPGLADYDGPHWNVAPSSHVLGLALPGQLEGSDPRAPLALGRYRWGLVPSWSKELTPGGRLFNARAETVASKPAFRGALRARRLAVIVDGFFEWRRSTAGRGQPLYFSRCDGFPLALAGLWEAWRDPVSETWLRSCAIITTTAGADMEAVHDRTPVVLERDQVRAWLYGEDADTADLMSFLGPAPAGTLESYPVDRRVGDVRNDCPELLDRVEPGSGQLAF
jgi:putative SOS response-associated peptidase YedK